MTPVILTTIVRGISIIIIGSELRILQKHHIIIQIIIEIRIEILLKIHEILTLFLKQIASPSAPTTPIQAILLKYIPPSRPSPLKVLILRVGHLFGLK